MFIRTGTPLSNQGFYSSDTASGLHWIYFPTVMPLSPYYSDIIDIFQHFYSCITCNCSVIIIGGNYQGSDSSSLVVLGRISRFEISNILVNIVYRSILRHRSVEVFLEILSSQYKLLIGTIWSSIISTISKHPSVV